MSHKFGHVVSSFSLNSKKSSISSLTKLSLSSVLFSFHVYVGFLLFSLLLTTSLSPMGFECVWDYLNLLVSVEGCFVSDYMVSFGEGTMRC